MEGNPIRELVVMTPPLRPDDPDVEVWIAFFSVTVMVAEGQMYVQELRFVTPDHKWHQAVPPPPSWWLSHSRVYQRCPLGMTQGSHQSHSQTHHLPRGSSARHGQGSSSTPSLGGPQNKTIKLSRAVARLGGPWSSDIVDAKLYSTS